MLPPVVQIRRSEGTLNFHFGTLNDSDHLTLTPGDDMADILGGSHTVGFAKHLQVDGTTTLGNVLTLDGGTFSSGSLVNPGLMQFTRGTFNLTADDLTIGPGGLLGSTILLSSAKTLNVTNATTIDAFGELELDRGTFSSGTLANEGLIGGGGRIDAPLVNAAGGTVRALNGEHQRFNGSAHANHGDVDLSGGTVEFSGLLTNETDGLITGNGTLIAADSLINHGEIELLAGAVQVSGMLTNDSDGLIAGNGSLSTDGGLLNSGTVALSAIANVTGDVSNAAPGLIISTGGTSTFFDDVANEGEIRTSLSSTSVFFGSLSGDGVFTGPGTVLVEGDLRPGSSPGQVDFGGDLALGGTATLIIELGGLDPADCDQINVDGTLALDGTLDVILINSFTPDWGDTFDIFDFDTCTGEFGGMSLPGLSSGLVWDTSALYTSGTVMVTPEPSSLVLLAAGALTLLLIRRRRK